MQPIVKFRTPYNTRIPGDEGGFAIPIAMGMGLLMIVMATAAIVRSQGDRVASINTKDAARSLLAAEAGVSQIQSFMNQYRAVASYPACQNRAGDGTCSDSGTTVSWANASQLPTSLNAVCSTEASLATAQATVQNWSTRTRTWANKWVEVDPSDTETDQTKRKGQFRLVEYNGKDLTVEGRVNPSQSNEALAQLKVTIPLFNSGTEQVAPLWVTGSVSGSPLINGDVMGSCSSTLAATVVSGKNYKTVTSRLPMPVATDQVLLLPVIAPLPLTATTFGGVTSRTYYQLANISSIPGQELPRTTANGAPANDQPAADGIYSYQVTSFDSSFKVPAGKKVRLWVTGNLDLSNKTIVNQCAGVASCTPFDVRIYGTSGTLTLNPATRICDVLFHMPSYDVVSSTTATANTTQSCGTDTISGVETKNTGIYWVRSWTGSGSGIAIDSPRVKWEQAPIQPPPRIGPSQAWTPQQQS